MIMHMMGVAMGSTPVIMIMKLLQSKGILKSSTSAARAPVLQLDASEATSRSRSAA